jgi:hypothetical protein
MCVLEWWRLRSVGVRLLTRDEQSGGRRPVRPERSGHAVIPSGCANAARDRMARQRLTPRLAI